MRTSFLVAVSFAFVVSSGVAARSQEDEQSLINDVETSPARKAAGSQKPAIKPKPTAAKEGGDPGDGGADSFSNFFDVKRRAKEGGDQAAAVLPATLEEALAKALQSSPTLLLAEVKLRQAQAEFEVKLRQAQVEFDEAKLNFVHDVTVAFHQRNTLRQKVEYTKKMLNKGYAVPSELQQMTDELQLNESKLAYMLGAGRELHAAAPSVRKVIVTPMKTFEKTYVFSRDSGEAVAKAGAAEKGAVEKRPEIPEKYRKILQKPMRVKFTAMPLNQIIDQLSQVTGKELPILLPSQQFGTAPITIELPNEVSLQTALEAVADMTRCVFIFRDYGLLVTHDPAAFRYPPSATIPEGAGGF